MTDTTTVSKKDQALGLVILAACVPVALFALACAVRGAELVAQLYSVFARFLGA